MKWSIRLPAVAVLLLIGISLGQCRKEPGEILLGIYVTAEGSIVRNEEGVTYILDISCGFDTQAEAQDNIDKLLFTVTMNGSALSPNQANGIFSGGGKWHVYTRFSTGKLGKGTYLISGRTILKPDTLIDSRSFSIVIE